MDPQDQLKERPPVDPVTGQPAPPPEVPEARTGRSTWPLVVIVLAGLVLALIAWLPAELTRDTEDIPATTSSTTQETAPAAPEAQPQPAPPPPEGTAPQPQTPPAQ
ncbi:hypothetical protein [Ensifer sp. BR816]|uniref:hypothetical protein n=1 Tax=Rhizobium sp. (strain BR816) TaxID=1057002 RepID=UPI000362F175|nr:hypothetical protein [Ensifer sp. BR816]